MKTIYQAAKEAGIPMEHHESDLYLPATPEVGRLMLETGAAGRVFRSHDGTEWVDIPFAFLPWWERRETEHQKAKGGR